MRRGGEDSIIMDILYLVLVLKNMLEIMMNYLVQCSG